MGLHAGIDFGTSNSGVAVSDGSQVWLLPIDEKNIIPEVVKSILYITKDQKAYIGQEALEIYYRNNINRQRRYIQKWMGEIEVFGADMFYVRDVYADVDELTPGRLLQYLKTALRSDDYHGTVVFDRFYSVADLITVYLRLLKQRAEIILGDTITEVTLGRPVKFSTKIEQDRQSQETLAAAAYAAGFEQVNFELEPVAAALYYEMTIARPQNVLIFDFGGGTLDITIMRLGDPRNRRVYANGGIDIAGSDFDRTIIEKRLLTHFGKGLIDDDLEILELVKAAPDWTALPELSTPRVRVRLEKAVQSGLAPVRLKALESLIYHDLAFSFYRAVEEAKIALSSQGAAVIALKDKDIDLWELYTRKQFEADIGDARQQIETVVLHTVASSGLDLAQIDAVVKTGGSSYIPAFYEMLNRIFGQDKVKASSEFTSVTAGLGIRAAQGGTSFA
jgi:hypothetical chaperone protein